MELLAKFCKTCRPFFTFLFPDMNFSDWERERKGLFVTDKNGDGGAKSRLQVAVKPPLPLFYTSKILEN